MSLKSFRTCLAIAAVLLVPVANADVISGPALTIDDTGWSFSGLGFSANQDATLLGFTFQNQGLADSVVLTDGSGNVLDFVNTPAGATSDAVSVNWALTAGDTYWLLQTTYSNALYAFYDAALPSDADITIIRSGTFANSVSDALDNQGGWPANEFWTAFNDITTRSAASVPEPGTAVLFALGLGALAFALRRRQGTGRQI